MTRKELPVLRGEIELEMKRLDEVVRRVEALRADLGQQSPSVVQRMAVAGFLHNLYNGIENCLTRIARGVDEHLPSGQHAHREILDQMAADLRSIRPPVIDERLLVVLDEYRRFRHAFRHTYFFELDWERMEPLAERARSTLSSLDAAMQALFASLDASC